MGGIKTRIVAGLLYRRIMDHCYTNRHGKNRRPPVTNAFKNSLEDLKNQPDLQSVLEEMGMNDTGAIGQEEEHGNDEEYAVHMRSDYRHVLSANTEIKAKEPSPEEVSTRPIQSLKTRTVFSLPSPSVIIQRRQQTSRYFQHGTSSVYGRRPACEQMRVFGKRIAL